MPRGRRAESADRVASSRSRTGASCDQGVVTAAGSRRDAARPGAASPPSRTTCRAIGVPCSTPTLMSSRTSTVGTPTAAARSPGCMRMLHIAAERATRSSSPCASTCPSTTVTLARTSAGARRSASAHTASSPGTPGTCWALDQTVMSRSGCRLPIAVRTAAARAARPRRSPETVWSDSTTSMPASVAGAARPTRSTRSRARSVPSWTRAAGTPRSTTWSTDAGSRTTTSAAAPSTRRARRRPSVESKRSIVCPTMARGRPPSTTRPSASSRPQGP